MSARPAVLVVDDSLTVRMDLTDAFQGAGFDVIPAATAAEARAALASTHVSVIVLDVLLPDADGVSMLRDLRLDPATRETPVLFLTGRSEVKDRITAMQLGGSDFLAKPFGARELRHKVRSLLQLESAEEG